MGLAVAAGGAAMSGPGKKAGKEAVEAVEDEEAVEEETD